MQIILAIDPWNQAECIWMCFYVHLCIYTTIYITVWLIVTEMYLQLQ